MKVGILVLHEREKKSQGGRSIFMTYSIRDESSSLDMSRLDSLEEVHHTLCLQSLQLRVLTDDCPNTIHSITEWRERERGGGGSSQLTLRMYVRLRWTDLRRTAMVRLPELICALVIISSISTTEPVEAGLPCSGQPDMWN